MLIIVLLLMASSCKAYARTAKTCVFAYFNDTLSDVVIDSVATHFDLIVLVDLKRRAVPKLREKALSLRKQRPIILVYKDCLRLAGPGNKRNGVGDETIGGWATVGGFWHFDSIFRGIGYKADTIFLMASDETKYKDKEGRVKASSSDSWKYCWAMDLGKEYWVDFYACSTKVQCLRNYADTTYDNTFFDGVFIDNVLHFNRQYGMFPKQYWDRDQPKKSNKRFQDIVNSFLRYVYTEYHNSNKPADKPREILAIGNTNAAYKQKGQWERYLQNLDGGMEEFFAQTRHGFDTWKKMVEEIRYAESKGKICLVRTDSDSYECISKDDPLSVVRFDSTQMIFGFTSYLMACDSMSYFSFQGDYQHIFHAPILNVDIGKPVSAYELREDSLAHRNFERGIVYCNPTSSIKSARISEGEYIRIRVSGDSVAVKDLHLKPYHGAVLKLRNK